MTPHHHTLQLINQATTTELLRLQSELLVDIEAVRELCMPGILQDKEEQLKQVNRLLTIKQTSK